jgi:hypothetical protein
MNYITLTFALLIVDIEANNTGLTGRFPITETRGFTSGQCLGFHTCTFICRLTRQPRPVASNIKTSPGN